ncbi:MAG: hypothetical protein J6T01_05685 [Kiritimatiellae bacterium]|nr:hypothetical protein [Kiritimatiellia bacterium]
MAFRKFEDIEIWKDGRAIVKKIYALTAARLFSSDFGAIYGDLERVQVKLFRLMQSLSGEPFRQKKV